MLARAYRVFGRFVRGLSTTLAGRAGAILTTSAFLVFVFMEALRLLGIVTNAYVGLITYMALPALFVVGLLLIPVGWWRLKRRTGRSTRELLSARFGEEMTEGTPVGSRLFVTVAVLTVVNLGFLGAGTARMLHFMDEPVFCGTACHSVMGPEWATYQDSPHAHVACVDCHVGEGAGALVDSKINGLWQLVSVTFDLYERPIPTPVHQLRPAQETCENCHWPEHFYGDRVQVRTRYGMDRANTPSYTTLVLDVGSGRGDEGEIHWHVSEGNTVRYDSVNDEREEILWTEVEREDGTTTRYVHRRLASPPEPTGETHGTARTMDCVDCHNRATHIYQDPERAVDHALDERILDPTMPWIRRAALQALTSSYFASEGAAEVLSRSLHAFYRERLPHDYPAIVGDIDDAAHTLTTIWERNIHPRMEVGWNPYPDHRGHSSGGGCFRCHHRDMVDETGEAVPYNCALCHTLLAWDNETPFAYLEDRAGPVSEQEERRYWRGVFLEGG